MQKLSASCSGYLFDSDVKINLFYLAAMRCWLILVDKMLSLLSFVCKILCVYWHVTDSLYIFLIFLKYLLSALRKRQLIPAFCNVASHSEMEFAFERHSDWYFRCDRKFPQLGNTMTFQNDYVSVLGVVLQ